MTSNVSGHLEEKVGIALVLASILSFYFLLQPVITSYCFEALQNFLGRRNREMAEAYFNIPAVLRLLIRANKTPRRESASNRTT